MKKLPALLNTPARAMIAVGVVILASELSNMVLIEILHATLMKDEYLKEIAWKFIDPILLVLLVSPALLLLIFKPMRAQQTEIERQLDELRRFQNGTVGRELRMKELVEEIAVLRNPLSAGSAGDIPVTSGSPEAPHEASEQYVATQATEERRHSALLSMLEELETARKEIERAHQEWMAALDAVNDLIFLHDKEFRILRCNKAYQQRTGMLFKQIIGKPYYEVFPKTGAPLPSCRRAMEKAEEEEEEKGEVAVGAAIYRSRAYSIHDERGAYLYSVHTLEDITERKQAEERLSESEKRYRTLFNSIDEGFCIIEVIFDENEKPIDYLFLEINPSFEKQTGLIDAQGKRMREIAPKHEEPWFEIYGEIYGKIAVTGEPVRFVNRAEQLNRWYEVYAFHFGQPEDRQVAILFDDITERKEGERKIQEQIERLEALREIDFAVLGSLDLKLTLPQVLAQVQACLSVDAASILLLNPHSHTLTFAAGRGFRGKNIECTRLHLGENHAGRAALERTLISIPNLCETGGDFLRTKLLEDEEFVSYQAAPLIAKGNVVGVLEVFHRALLTPDDDWLSFFQTLAGQTAIAIDNSTLFTSLQRANTDLVLAYDATIEGWSHAMDLRDKETEGHTQRVTEMTERLARATGMGEAEIVQVRRGALLHDMGKMGVPDGILLKPDKLTDEEWVQMRKHPQLAYDMLSPIAYLKPAIDIPYCHHEKWDGSGYPRGLKGEEIPLAARLFAIVDVWDALTSNRPYRAAWSKEKTLEHVQSLAGTHFDPKVVELFLKMMNEPE